MFRLYGFIVFCLMLMACGPALTAREACSLRCDESASVSAHSLCVAACKSSARESVVGTEYAGDFPEEEQRLSCAGYIQQPMLFVPKKKAVVLVRRGTAEFYFHGYDTLLGGAISTDLNVDIGEPIPTLPRRIERSVNDQFEIMLMSSLAAVTYASDKLWRPASVHDSENLGGLKIVKACWRKGNGPSQHMWPPDNVDSFPSPICRTWNAVANRFVDTELDVDVPRFNAVMELQAYMMQTNSDGVKERGTMFFHLRSETNLCGPASHAQSGIEAALRSDVGTNYQLIGYGGAIWKLGDQKPPTPGTWSGHNGPW